MAVRLAPGAAAGKEFPNARALGSHGHYLVRVTGADQVQKMLDQPGVLATSPVVEAEGAWAILTDESIVRFRPEATPEQVQSVLQSFTEIPREHLARRSHLLRVSTRSGVEALQEANRVARLPFVQYAEPNFLNLVDGNPDATRNVAFRKTATRTAPAQDATNPKGAATWTTILDEDFSKPFPAGNGWTVSGNPTWGRVGLSETECIAVGSSNQCDGPSSACPVVAGVVALMLSESPGLTVDEVRDILQRTADDLETVQLVGQPVGDLLGYGRVNADAATLALETKKSQAGTNAALGDGSGGGCFIATAAYG